MLIITDKNPYKAAQYLIKNTNKNFVFKQLLELCQLICSCRISNVYKKIPQGKELQDWVFNNKYWVWGFFDSLFAYALQEVNLKTETITKFKKIQKDLFNSLPKESIVPETVIWRYKQGYESKYKTNTELPIDECCELYKEYLEWKFPKKRKDKIKYVMY